MGATDLTPIFGSWNYYVPILVLLVALSTLVDAYGRVTKMLGLDSYAVFTDDQENEDYWDVQDGQVLIDAARVEQTGTSDRQPLRRTHIGRI